MSTLLVAVDAGSLSAAARRLGMPLTTVSRRVTELEQYLGTRLLTRSSRQLLLTDAGRVYVGACKRLLSELDDVERAARGEYTSPKGEIVVAAPLVLGRTSVLPVVDEFLRAYPEIDVRLVFSDRNSNLLEEQIDVALRVGDLPDSSLVATRVGTIRRVICASATYLAERGTPSTPSDLATHDCITFEAVSFPHVWHFQHGEAVSSATIHSRLTVNTADAAIEAAEAGLGITRVWSYQTARAEQAGTLVRVLQSFEPPVTPVHLVHTGQPPYPLKLRAFLDFAAPRLKTRIAAACAATVGEIDARLGVG